MDLQVPVVAAKHQISSELDGEAVILDLEQGVYYGLNEVGARVWQLIQQPRPLEQVHRTLVNEFDVAPDECERDLVALVERLESAGLIVRRNAVGA
ncbi:MAG: PqqD family protein [Tepidisphaeraceae bacterium]|jgi:hypothetical protein